MSGVEHVYLPVVPDRLESVEFLGIVIEDGRELGVRERIDARATFELARADAERFAERCNRCGPGNAYPLVLRRALGPWELAER